LERQIEKKRLVKQGAMQRLLTAGEDWEVRTLGEVGDFKNGINKSKDDFGFGYPFVNLMDVFGVNTINAEKKLGLVNSNNAERQMYELKKGDVLFIRSSVKPSGVGLTSLVEKDLLNTVFSGFIIRFRDKGFLADNFKKYCFYTKDFRDRLIGSSTVSANTNINQEALKKLELSFPKSLEEQTRIATILSDMDAAIEGLEKQLEKYRAVKVGLMQELLSGRKRLIDN
jgi:type I restriction enzyme S subunit